MYCFIKCISGHTWPSSRWKLLEAGIPLPPHRMAVRRGWALRSGTGCGGRLHRAATSAPCPLHGWSSDAGHPVLDVQPWDTEVVHRL